MDRERLLKEITKFCNVPYSKHGARGGDGRYKHDWAHLVETVSRLAYGDLPSSESISRIAARLRIEYRNSETGWNARVNETGVHDNILSMILKGLEEQFGPVPFPPTNIYPDT